MCNVMFLQKCNSRASSMTAAFKTSFIFQALAAKTILWPIAGIALLGAAAALVTNPVLLQLGVVSGRRKRRETTNEVDFESNSFANWLKSEPGKYLTKRHVKTSNNLNVMNNSNTQSFKYLRIENGDVQTNLSTHSTDNTRDNLKRNIIIDKLLAGNKYRTSRNVRMRHNDVESDILRKVSDEDKNYIPILLKTNNG